MKEWDNRLEEVGAYVGEIPTNQKFESRKKEYRDLKVLTI